MKIWLVLIFLKIIYELAGESKNQGLFEVDQTQGTIHVKSNLEKENLTEIVVSLTLLFSF